MHTHTYHARMGCTSWHEREASSGVANTHRHRHPQTHTHTHIRMHTHTMHVWAVHHGTREKPARVLRKHTDTTHTYVCTHTPCTCGLYIMARGRGHRQVMVIAWVIELIVSVHCHALDAQPHQTKLLCVCACVCVRVCVCVCV